MKIFYKRENANESNETFSNLIEVFLDKFSQECFDKKIRQEEALAMLLKQGFLFLVYELELLSPDQFKSFLQTENLTSADSKKFFEDYFKKHTDPSNFEPIFSKLSNLNTLFYILCEWKINKIDINEFFLESQENKQNMKKLIEIMSKLEQEDLKELINANNDMIGNFHSYSRKI